MKRRTPQVVAAALTVMFGTVASANDIQSNVHVEHRADRGEITVTVDGINIPAATAYSHHPSEERVKFRWPSTGSIPQGAMAFLAGPFIPDDATKWPTIDPSHPEFQRDLQALLGGYPAAPHKHGSGGRDR